MTSDGVRVDLKAGAAGICCCNTDRLTQVSRGLDRLLQDDRGARAVCVSLASVPMRDSAASETESLLTKSPDVVLWLGHL
jgi:hypothetical protein